VNLEQSLDSNLDPNLDPDLDLNLDRPDPSHRLCGFSVDVIGVDVIGVDVIGVYATLFFRLATTSPP
jgi:hypothetical protein